jgi:hypothetical protein
MVREDQWSMMTGFLRLLAGLDLKAQVSFDFSSA